MAKKKLDHLFKEINNKKYREKGIKWRCPLKGHYWIEIQVAEYAVQLGVRLRMLKEAAREDAKRRKKSTFAA